LTQEIKEELEGVYQFKSELQEKYNYFTSIKRLVNHYQEPAIVSEVEGQIILSDKILKSSQISSYSLELFRETYQTVKGQIADDLQSRIEKLIDQGLVNQTGKDNFVISKRDKTIAYQFEDLYEICDDDLIELFPIVRNLEEQAEVKRQKQAVFNNIKELLKRQNSEVGEDYFIFNSVRFNEKDLGKYAIEELQQIHSKVRQKLIEEILEKACKLEQSEVGAYILADPLTKNFTISKYNQRKSYTPANLHQQSDMGLIAVHSQLSHLERKHLDPYDQLRSPEKPFFGYSELKQQIERNRANNRHYDAINLWIDLNKYKTKTGKYLNLEEIYSIFTQELELGEPETEKRRAFRTELDNEQNRSSGELDWLKIEKAYNQQLPLLERDLLSKREITAQIEKIYPFCLEISKEEGKLYYDYEGNLVPLSDCPLATLEFVLQRGETTLRHIIAETLNEFRQVYRDKVVFNDKGTLTTYRNGERIEICASEDSLPVGGLGDLYQTILPRRSSQPSPRRHKKANPNCTKLSHISQSPTENAKAERMEAIGTNRHQNRGTLFRLPGQVNRFPINIQSWYRPPLMKLRLNTQTPIALPALALDQTSPKTTPFPPSTAPNPQLCTISP